LVAAEAAAYLNVSIKQLSRWRQAGLITPSKPSGDYGRNFYAPADLDALMESAKG
jgi:DNA-binding transcriptional MerR regulator